MNQEELNAILENADLTPEQRTQAILDLHEADKKGVALKNAELIAAEKKIKEAREKAEKELAEALKRATEIETELKKNNPEDRQKYYDAKVLELETKHKTDMEALNAEMSKYKAAHIARIKDEAVAEGIKELKLIPAYKDAYIARVMSLNNFELVEIDGKSVFINNTNKTIDAVLREFALTNEGKAFIENQSTGGGSPPGSPGKPSNNGTPTGQTMNREQFMAMPSAAQMEFVNKGGKVVNAA